MTSSKAEKSPGKVCGKRVLACWTSSTCTQRVFLADHEDGSFGWLCQYFERFWRESDAYVCRSRFDNEASARADILRNIPWTSGANEDRVMENLILTSEYEDALSSCDRERLEAWLLSGGSPFSELSDGRRILDTIIELGWISTVRLLLEKGMKLHPRGWSSLSPLQVAASRGDCEMIELLAQYAADVNEVGCDPDTSPLQLALRDGNIEAAKILLRHGARLPDNALMLAIISSNPDAVGFVIECGADVNKLDQEEPPLFTAADTGNIEIAKLLLAHGAKVNPEAGWLPVEVAIKQKDKVMTGFLVEQGAIVPDHLKEQWMELSQ